MAGRRVQSNEYRTVNSLMHSLRKIQKDLGVQDPSELVAQGHKDQVEKTFDKFKQLKYQMSHALRDLRSNVKHCEQMKERASQVGQRSPDCIAQIARNEVDIKAAMDLAKQLATQWKRDKETKGKGRLSSREVEDRARALQFIGQELDNLYQRNGRVETAYVEMVSVLPAPDQTVLREQAQFRKNTREHLKTKGVPVQGESEFNGKLTETERQFAGHIEFIHHEQNKLLAEVGGGLRELKAVSEEMTTGLRYQQQLSKDIGKEMREVDGNLDVSNKRLKELMEKSGGAGLWCTRIVCFVFLVSLVMTFVGMLTGATDDAQTNSLV